tara:strand:+ start:380 stop:595 length:216 start_codon:yes stop_codon:yes gene_type:complete
MNKYSFAGLLFAVSLWHTFSIDPSHVMTMFLGTVWGFIACHAVYEQEIYSCALAQKRLPPSDDSPSELPHS